MPRLLPREEKYTTIGHLTQRLGNDCLRGWVIFAYLVRGGVCSSEEQFICRRQNASGLTIDIFTGTGTHTHTHTHTQMSARAHTKHLSLAHTHAHIQKYISSPMALRPGISRACASPTGALSPAGVEGLTAAAVAATVIAAVAAATCCVA